MPTATGRRGRSSTGSSKIKVSPVFIQNSSSHHPAVVKSTIDVSPGLPIYLLLRSAYIHVFTAPVQISQRETILNPLKVCHIKFQISTTAFGEFIHEIAPNIELS